MLSVFKEAIDCWKSAKSVHNTTATSAGSIHPYLRAPNSVQAGVGRSGNLAAHRPWGTLPLSAEI